MKEVQTNSVTFYRTKSFFIYRVVSLKPILTREVTLEVFKVVSYFPLCNSIARYQLNIIILYCI